MLKIWDWMSGDVLNEIQIFDSVLPFIKVRPPKRKRAKDREEGHDGDSDQRKGRNAKQREAGGGVANTPTHPWQDQLA